MPLPPYLRGTGTGEQHRGDPLPRGKNTPAPPPDPEEQEGKTARGEDNERELRRSSGGTKQGNQGGEHGKIITLAVHQTDGMGQRQEEKGSLPHMRGGNRLLRSAQLNA